MNLPVVDPFQIPYHGWTWRTPSIDEMKALYRQTSSIQPHVRDKLVASVASGFEAAIYIGKVGADSGIDAHINDALDNDPNFAIWRRAMPSSTPKPLKDYKSKYPQYDGASVDFEIHTHGAHLSPGQVLFHAGAWPGGVSFVSDRPLSTSFCPQVALRNAEHKGKAYDAGRLDIFVVRVATSAALAFVYKRKGASLGHENEVLFASGVTLTLISEHLVRPDYPVGKAFSPAKHVPLYVLDVILS